MTIGGYSLLVCIALIHLSSASQLSSTRTSLIIQTHIAYLLYLHLRRVLRRLSMSGLRVYFRFLD